ncbi:MAG: DUF1211 domain-containing protein [Ktedonobacteraceae bacterium]|nr:DUF1211 domain-containing protein [Ktedonobacteraceae bacterium]
MKIQNNPETVSVLSKSRIEAFSDGVFAVAITLLVLGIHLPTFTVTPKTHAEIAQQLLLGLEQQWPAYASYVFSSIIVGIYWVAHHNTFHYIIRSDRNLLWLNILLLICIVFIPFPTTLLGQYPEQQVSVIVYAGTLVITGIVLQLLWWYATSNYRLVDRNIDAELVQRATRRNLMAPLIYLLAIALSFLSVQASLGLLILVPVYYVFPTRIDRHWTLRQYYSVEEAEGNLQEVSSDQKKKRGTKHMAKQCNHLDQIQEVTPSAQGCEGCLEIGDRWVHLRECLICGHMGCCDSSKNKHATKHFHATGHPIVQSYEPGEDWRWCYIDQVMF